MELPLTPTVTLVRKIAINIWMNIFSLLSIFVTLAYEEMKEKSQCSLILCLVAKLGYLEEYLRSFDSFVARHLVKQRLLGCECSSRFWVTNTVRTASLYKQLLSLQLFWHTMVICWLLNIEEHLLKLIRTFYNCQWWRAAIIELCLMNLILRP